jgi:hypothetical protein
MTGIDSVTEAGIDIGRRAAIAQRRGQFPCELCGKLGDGVKKAA